MQQQTVYLPTGEDTPFAVSEFNCGSFKPIFENVEKVEGYFFTQEELYDLLKDVCGSYFSVRESYIETLLTPNQ